MYPLVHFQMRYVNGLLAELCLRRLYQCIHRLL